MSTSLGTVLGVEIRAKLDQERHSLILPVQSVDPASSTDRHGNEFSIVRKRDARGKFDARVDGDFFRKPRRVSVRESVNVLYGMEVHGSMYYNGERVFFVADVVSVIRGM